MKHLIIRAEREEYDVSKIHGMTVEEFMKELRHHDPKAIVALAMDAGMFGSITSVREVNR